MTSGGSGTLSTPVLESPVAGPRADVRPRVADGGRGKEGDRNNEENEETSSERRRGSSTPSPETTAVAPECGHKTGEMSGGREDARPGAGAYGKTGEEAGSKHEEGVGIRPDRKMTRSMIRLERKKKGAGADRPSPTRKRAESAEVVRIGYKVVSAEVKTTSVMKKNLRMRMSKIHIHTE